LSDKTLQTGGAGSTAAAGTLAGRAALVTGGSRGIGLAIARALAGAGCRLMINGLEDPATARAACAELESAGARQAVFDGGNLLEDGAARRLVERTVEELGGLQILVNNAGIQHVAPVEAFPEDVWERIIALNLGAPFRLIRESLPHMRDAGFGRIVNISSVHGLVASAGKAAYVSAKHGLVGLTRTVALETAVEPITCNAICPGYARTDLLEEQIEARAAAMGRPVSEAAPEFLAEKQPSRTFVDPSAIGSLALYLCSDAAAQVTGAALPIDGGWTAQ